MMLNAQSAASICDCRKEAEMNQKSTILYERLSREDGEDGVSNSILNQRKILEEYAERNNLMPYEHIQDDGYSGTNWNRPGWQKLIAEVEAGRVHTIVVKNLDRMGRDYLRVGLLFDVDVKHKLKKSDFVYRKFIKTFSIKEQQQADGLIPTACLRFIVS